MSVRFYNCRILTMEDNKVTEGELWTENDRISYIGPSADKGDKVFDREIDCKGGLLMPGLKNAHTHSAMTFSRSLADEYCLNDWLFKAIFPREAKLTAESVYWLSKLAYAEYLSGGITACFDMYFEKDANAKAAVETGFRHVFCGAANDFGGMEELEDFYDRLNSYDPLVSFIYGFHAEYTTCEDNLKKISELAHKYEAPVFAHISETKAEVDGCIERYGCTPAVLFDRLGIYDFGGGGFHCVWFTDEDRDIFKKRGLWSVFNACSNLKLASGITPVYKFIANDMKIAIGTDGAGSNNSLSMFREMYLDTVLSNVETGNAAAVDPFTILKAGTTGGALCMGLKDSDVLAVGKKADIILIDMNRPSMQPENNIARNIVYSADNSVVKMTMIDGKILYEDGKYSTLDLDEVIRECNKLMKDLA
ncbi:amidohydrolase [Butyrivibrio sp. AE2032]|uniref:amidohydrolase n=1 Tax=Butyrivibrio sp. AE2032 TaxID=1458463 RepID=UPI0005515A8E|nr:amidohydrolase [Butyrivibrio sp. AE2032]